MLPWNDAPITAAERDRAGLETLALVASLDPGSPRSVLLRAEVAALLMVGILIETGEQAADKRANADEVIDYVLTRMREFIREADDALEP